MDDDRKKFPRKNGGKPGGPRRPTGGKPPFAGKPRAEGKKPYVKRSPQAASAGERPKRDFRRDDRPRGEGAEQAAGASKPFRKGPPRGDRPFAKREGERRTQAVRQACRRRPQAICAQGRRRCCRRAAKARFRSASVVSRRASARARQARSASSSATTDRDDDRRFERPRAAGRRRRCTSKQGWRAVLWDQRAMKGQRRSYGMKSHDGGDRKPFKKRADAVEEVAGERIAKRLARAGIASRRDAEELIAAGRVRVNGRKLDSPAFNVLPEDRIEVDGTAIPADRAHAAVSLPQAGGRGDHQPRPGRPKDRFRRAAGRPAAADDDRPARHQHGRPAAADQ